MYMIWPIAWPGEIKKSDEYKSYREIRDKIRDNKTTLEMLRIFRRKQFKLQSRALLPGEDNRGKRRRNQTD